MWEFNAMIETPRPLTAAERVRLVASLIYIRQRLDACGEMQAAVHLTHALDCLAPEGGGQPDAARRLH